MRIKKAGLSLLLIVLAVTPCFAKWQIRTLGGRDYVPLWQVANFYQMRLVPRGEKGVTLASDTRRMDFNSGSREARIDWVKSWLSFPTLVFEGQLYVSRMDLSKTIDPAMRPSKIPGLQPVRAVLLDPGKGGSETGAVNRYGMEKDYNLAISLEVQRLLREAGLRAELTRSADDFVSTEERVAMPRELGEGTIFVSIQCNSAGETSSPETGFEIYTLTPRGAASSHESFLAQRSFSAETGHRFDHANQALAASVYHAMLGRVPMFDRGMKRARFLELRDAIAPAVIVKCGFMTNPRDARLLNDYRWRDRLADSIARGIIEFCNLTRSRKPPKLLASYRKEEVAAIPSVFADPLVGIGAAVQFGFAHARGWRALLPDQQYSDLGGEFQEALPFRMEFMPSGWVRLETCAAAGEGTRKAIEESDKALMSSSVASDSSIFTLQTSEASLSTGEQKPAPESLSLSLGGIRINFVWVPVEGLDGIKEVEIGDFGGGRVKERKRAERIYAPFERNGQRGYYLSKTEVSQEQWAAVMGEGDRTKLPVTGKTYSEVQAFLDKINSLVRESGEVPSTSDDAAGVVKLPAEAEWEYAARGGEWSGYGEDDPYGGDLERYEVFSLPGSDGKAKEVGSRPPNRLGLHDMLGNVRELMDGSYSVGGVAGGGLLLKGGSYLSEKGELRSSSRTEHQRMGKDSKPTRRPDAGLRLAISAEIVTSLEVKLPEFEDSAEQALR
jgi:N-acetylmuramoyl-L-alanine amidase